MRRPGNVQTDVVWRLFYYIVKWRPCNLRARRGVDVISLRYFVTSRQHPNWRCVKVILRRCEVTPRQRPNWRCAAVNLLRCKATSMQPPGMTLSGCHFATLLCDVQTTSKLTLCQCYFTTLWRDVHATSGHDVVWMSFSYVSMWRPGNVQTDVVLRLFYDVVKRRQCNLRAWRCLDVTPLRDLLTFWKQPENVHKWRCVAVILQRCEATSRQPPVVTSPGCHLTTLQNDVQKTSRQRQNWRFVEVVWRRCEVTSRQPPDNVVM